MVISLHVNSSPQEESTNMDRNLCSNTEVQKLAEKISKNSTSVKLKKNLHILRETKLRLYW
jgi:hypothetical protein